MKLFERMVRNLEGGAGGDPAGGADTMGGGGSDTQAGAGGQDTVAGAQGDPAKVEAPKPYRPEGLPDHLAGKDERETIDKLFKQNEGFRKKMGEWGEIPADPKGYAFEPSDVVKPYAPNLEGDGVFEMVRAAAHKHQIAGKQFNGFINDILGGMIEGQMIEPPFDVERERAALAPDEADPKKRAEAADRQVREAQALVDTWKEQGLPEDAATLLKAGLDRAANVKALQWLARRNGETMPALGGGKTSGVTEADLDKRVADPRNKVNDPKYDKAFAAETTRMFQEFYGAGEGRG